MQNRNDRRRSTNLRSLVLISVFIIAVAVVAVPFYSVRSSSLPKVGSSQASAPSRVGTSPISGSHSRPGLLALASFPFFAEAIVVSPPATRAPGCTNPAVLCLGETVTATVTEAPLRADFRERRLLWVAPDGSVPQMVDITTDPQVDTYTLPTTGSFAQVGTWAVRTINNRGGVVAVTTFEVGDPTQPSTDLAISVTGPTTVTANTTASYGVTITNNGPDTADNVTLFNPVPYNSTFVSASIPAGFACTTPALGEVGDIACTSASLAFSASAAFTFVFNVNSDVINGTSVYEWAKTGTSTNEPDKSNNVSDIYASSTPPGGGGGTCTLDCPEDVNAIANTTEASVRGAHVSFSPTTDAGDCGAVTTTPASGSFFPVGTTVVTSTSADNGGSCSFTVTVEDQGIDPPTISCPANQHTTANSSCEAQITLGTPTASGNNVTVVGSRSDGRPMYNCDAFGENCVRKATDLPFFAGITTVTWTAYSHDVAGPYANSDAEEAHRTGNASCNQIITIDDVTLPTISAGPQQASADANCQAPVPDYSTIAVVSDNCSCASSDTSEICDTRQDITITQSPAAGTLVGLGPHTITLTANDGSSNNNGAGNTTSINVTFTVNDTTAPTFTFVPPTVVAYTGPGATTCATVVSDATLGTATATDNCGAVTITRLPSGNTFPVGDTIITWKATDGAGNQSTATQTVTVIDNTVPVITTNGQTPSMWPPNHKYQTFQLTGFVTGASDNCGGVGLGNVVIEKVTSDEIENGNGDGNTTNDIVIAANCKSVQLRSEREGNSNGRVYTITFKVTDTHGNVGRATSKVVVAHNPGETAVDSGVHYTVMSSCP